MAHPLYPSLIPRYVDESWFASDQPVDEAAKLTELESHEMWIPDTQYRNVESQSHQLQAGAIDVDDDEDGDEGNEDDLNDDDQEEDDDMDDGEEAEDEYANDEA